jgi:hypothetical protein
MLDVDACVHGYADLISSYLHCVDLGWSGLI